MIGEVEKRTGLTTVSYRTKDYQKEPSSRTVLLTVQADEDRDSFAEELGVGAGESQGDVSLWMREPGERRHRER